MNWLIIGLPLAVFYLTWFGYLIYKNKPQKSLVVFALAHSPYLILNLVAPFRGIMDANYAGYSMGLIQLPPGIWVTIVVGAIVVMSFLVMTKALQNKMAKWWIVTVIFDLLILIAIAGPVLLDTLTNMEDYRLELGEYLQLSGWVVALFIISIIPGPMLYATWKSLENSLLLAKFERKAS